MLDYSQASNYIEKTQSRNKLHVSSNQENDSYINKNLIQML